MALKKKYTVEEVLSWSTFIVYYVEKQLSYNK